MEATPASVNAAVNAFAQALVLLHTDAQGNFTLTEQGLLSIFSTPGWMDIPFMSHIETHDRFTLSVAAKQPPAPAAGQAPAPENVRYFGREALGDLANKFTDRRSCLIVSPMGCGKSHLINAAVLYYRLKSILFPNPHNPVVVYIANCDQFRGSSMYGQLLGALKTAFPDDGAVNAEAYDAVTTTKQTISGHVTRLRGLHTGIVFVYDDFNTFLNHNERASEKDMGEFMLALTDGCKKIMITSGMHTHYQGHHASVGWPKYHINPSLTDAEWNVWIANNSYPLWNDTTDATEREELQYMTGRVPLYLTAIDAARNGGTQSFTEALNLFASDSTDGGGGHILTLMRHFISKVIVSSEVGEYIRCVKFTMIHEQPVLHKEWIDYRFFRETRTGVRVVNGFIALLLRDLIRELAPTVLYEECDKHWVRTGLASGIPSVRGFAFETFCICQFIREHPGVFVSRFDGNYPEEERSDAMGLTLYWPRKWNLRYVDFVTRQVVPATKATRGHPATTSFIEIKAYQVTLQAPTNHAGTLRFYTTLHTGNLPAGAAAAGVPDCARYEKISDVLRVDHELVWMVDRIPTAGLPGVVAIHGNRLAQPVPAAAGGAPTPQANAYTQRFQVKQITVVI